MARRRTWWSNAALRSALIEGVGWTPPLNGLPTAFAAIGYCRLFTTYSGPLVRLRRSTDDAQSDFSSASNGWLNPTEIATWRGAGDAFVVTHYDQTGNGRHVTQATAANQGMLATHCRSVILDGTNDTASMTSSLGYGRNIAGLTAGGVALSTSKVADNALFQINTPVPNNRFRLVRLATSGALAIQSRRLDADATATLNTASDVGDVWHRMIGRRDYAAAAGKLRVDGVDVTGSLGTAGSTSDTDSPALMSVGSGSGTSSWVGETSALVWFQEALSDGDLSILDTGLARIQDDVMDVWEP